MTQAALLRIVRAARKGMIFRRMSYGWDIDDLPRRETIRVECDENGCFDYRGREDYEGPYEEFMSVEAAAKHLQGDEVIRLQLWGHPFAGGGRGNNELLDIAHLDLITGQKIEVQPPNDSKVPIGRTTTGVLPSEDGT